MARAFKLHCTKLFLVVYNLAFVLFGAAILTLGIWLHFDTNVITMLQIMEETPSEADVTQMAAYITIGVGAFVLLVGFLGCCGACCESMCMLCLYTCLVFLVLAGELTCGVLLAVYKEKISKTTSAKMHHQVRFEYNQTNNASAITHMWDTMQVKLNCCGALGPQDFELSYFFNSTEDGKGLFVPWTCCLMSNDDPKYPQVLNSNQCQIDAMLYPSNFDVHKVTALKTVGCHQAVQGWLNEHLGLVVGVIMAVIVLEILGLIIACCLMSSIRYEQSKYPWNYNSDDEDD